MRHDAVSRRAFLHLAASRLQHLLCSYIVVVQRRVLEPILKVVESGESVVIRYMVPAIGGGTICGQQSTGGWRRARVCAIPAT